MAKKQKKYNRLPGKKRGLLGYNTLWLGPDHMLAVVDRTFAEDYKRFYYRDIQAVTIRKIESFKIVATIIAAVSSLLVLFTFFFKEPWSIFFGVMSGVFFFGLIMYLIAGASYECYIKTAVQIEKLPSIFRLKTYEKVMNLLRPMIEEAQGTMPVETIRENISRILKENSDANSRRRPVRPQQVRHENGGWHKASFGMLLFSGLIYFTGLFYHNVALSAFGTIISVLISIVLIISLIKQNNSDMAKSVRLLTWATFGYFCIDFVLGNILFFILFFKNIDNSEIINNHFLMMKMVLEMSPDQSPFVMGCYIFSVVSTWSLGISGLILLKKSKSSSAGMPSTSGESVTVSGN